MYFSFTTLHTKLSKVMHRLLEIIYHFRQTIFTFRTKTKIFQISKASALLMVTRISVCRENIDYFQLSCHQCIAIITDALIIEMSLATNAISISCVYDIRPLFVSGTFLLSQLALTRSTV